MSATYLDFPSTATACFLKTPYQNTQQEGAVVYPSEDRFGGSY